MSSLAKLKSAKSLGDLATLLGFKPNTLAFVVYKIPNSSKYTEFEITKKNGGKRLIKAPVAKLKNAQRRLANLLYQCVAEIEQTPPIRSPLYHGFSKSRSIVTNASRHSHRRFVFNIDIQDFFPSINFGRVRGCFIKDKKFGLHPDVATVIAQIACHDNSLPQGSPCSPVISNIVGGILDLRLVRLAKKSGCTYSRYADDVTFSTRLRYFPEAIATATPIGGTPWLPGPELLKEVNNAGFSINPNKTRMQVKGSRQLTTGLLVNEKPNIRPEYYRLTRSMCSALFATGSYFTSDITSNFSKTTATSLSSLEGRMSHIYQVRNSIDQRATKDKKKDPTATRRLYQRLLHYKNFIALDRPLVITEGQTDQIYLKAAIERLLKFHPTLGSLSAGKFSHSLKFMKYTRTVHDVMQLGGGTGDLKHLLLQYKDMHSSFKHAPCKHPVIVVIDNDDGADEIFSVMKGMGIKITHTSTEPFFHIHSNIYLVKTPLLPTKLKTCIEDFFDSATLAIELDGKKFDSNKPHGDSTSYGKARFAEKVIAPNKGTIDFSGFEEILERIKKVVEHHAI